MGCCAPISSSSRAASRSRSSYRHANRHHARGAPHLDAHLLPDAARIDVDAELPAVLHRLSVERQHDVARLEAGFRRRPVRQHVRQHHAGIEPEAERLGHERRDRLRVDADFTPPHAPRLPDLREHIADDVAGGGKADSLAAAGLRVNQRIDANEPPLGVNQCPPAVAGIDGRVGLDVDHRIIRGQLPRDGADDAQAHRRLEPERAAERQHDLAGPQRVRVTERQHRQSAHIHLHDRDVGLVIDRDHLCANRASAALQDRSSLRPSARVERELHLDARRVLDDVGVGDDVAVGIHDDPRPAAPLEHWLPGRRAVLLVGWRVAGHEDLHDRRADLRRKVLERPREVRQARRWGCLLRK